MLETLPRETKDGCTIPPDLLAGESAGAIVEETGAPPSAVALAPAQVGLWVVLATVTMLFAGFSSAYLVRRAAPDWVPIACPPILWISTAVLLWSSLALEKAKSSQRRHCQGPFRLWLLGGLGGGLAFVAAQLFAWRQLSALGIYLPTSPHSSFFYMLTGVHAAHVLGGIAGLLYASQRVWRPPTPPATPDPLALVATYWHFVTGVWIYLFILLFVWQ